MIVHMSHIYRCDHNVGLYIYDDPFILDGCVHTLDVRFTYDPSHSNGCTHTIDIFHIPYYPDGCVHTVDSCFDIRHVYVYASLICRSPNSVCSRPCKRS